jgi:hypothetical protein
VSDTTELVEEHLENDALSLKTPASSCRAHRMPSKTAGAEYMGVLVEYMGVRVEDIP